VDVHGWELLGAGAHLGQLRLVPDVAVEEREGRERGGRIEAWLAGESEVGDGLSRPVAVRVGRLLGDPSEKGGGLAAARRIGAASRATALVAVDEAGGARH